jgi:three-Cys-motif partner protein
MASTNDFFDESTEQSEIKSRIVADYFSAWAQVIKRTARQRTGRIAYLDLFAGPGRYKDGTDSTPIVVLKKAIADPTLSQMLVTRFNDKTKQHAIDLKHTIETLPGIERLKYPPRVENREIDSKFVETLENIRLVPSFLFVDPWGYKGLSLALIRSVLKDWGCDCVFFFNYNRVNMGLANEIVREHMDLLFREGRADSLRKRLEGAQPAEREKLVLKELSDALKELGAKYVRPFSFRNVDDTRTTHHLVFASKNFKGYEIMKDIMGRESSISLQGVPSFVHSAAHKTNELLPG